MRTRKKALYILLIFPILLFCHGDEFFYAIIGTNCFASNDFATIFSGTVFNGVNINDKSPVAFMGGLFPVIIFNLLFGTYIYKDLCVSGIYYFIRQDSRKHWYFDKLMHLFFCSSCYTFLEISILYISSLFLADSVPTIQNLILAFSFFIFLNIFTYFTTLIVNLLSIKYGSILGFIGMYSFLILCLLITLQFGAIYIADTFVNVCFFLPTDITFANGGLAPSTFLSAGFTILYTMILMYTGYQYISKTDLSLINKELLL